MIVLDTNVLSALMQQQPGVQVSVREMDENDHVAARRDSLVKNAGYPAFDCNE